ncbi:MAG: hypothetical protein GYA46_02190 [candidate division Zixibacteria bacterium]|nr:hypothetical protein [candidate division Zixibacteria bacterium]
MSRWVGGLRIIQPMEALYINPADAARVGIVDREKVVVAADGFERVWPAIIDHSQPPGEVRVTVNVDEWDGGRSLSVAIRKQNG